MHIVREVVIQIAANQLQMPLVWFHHHDSVASIDPRYVRK